MLWYDSELETKYKAKVSTKATLSVAAHAIKVYLVAKEGDEFAPWLATNEGVELEHKSSKGFERLQGLDCNSSQKDAILNKAAKNIRHDLNVV